MTCKFICDGYFRFLIALFIIPIGFGFILTGSYIAFDKNRRFLGAALFVLGLFLPCLGFWQYWIT